MAQTYKTDPFGVATGGTGSVTNPWQFADEYKDPLAAANLHKVGARNYDPTIGRWTQQDPLDQAGDLQNANKYLYAASDPVNGVDPNGTFLIKRGWYGTRYLFTKREGRALAVGTAAFIPKIPGKVAQVGVGLAAAVVVTAADYDKGLRILDPVGSGPIIPYFSKCG